MKYSYYPGCTLKNKAKDLDAYARASANPGASAVRQVLPVLSVRPHPASRHRHRIAANSRFMKTASFFISTSLSAQTVILFPVLQIFPEIIIFLKLGLDILLSPCKISIRLEV